jgi:hypothetical protein
MVGHGGARNRSGPAVDPNSGRSEARGLQFKLLPRQGFEGRIPTFPLPDVTARERKVWRELWRTPQAAMWDAERWRVRTVALYCRMSVLAESAERPATLVTATIRLQDQIGLTPAGLKENGWRISTDEVAAKREAEPSSSGAAPSALRHGRSAG